MPLLDQIWFCRLSSWAVLLIEFTGFTLIWFKPVRPYVLIAMLLLHLGIAYLFILPFFQFLFMVTLVTFMEPELVKDMMAVGADVFQYARAMVKSGKQAKSDSPV
jgi:hypothetical protein